MSLVSLTKAPTRETVASGSEGPVVALTPTAIRQIKRLQEKQGKQDWYLRLGVRGGGCSGLSYVIDMEKEPDTEFDLVYDVEDLKIVIDRKSALYLKGTTLNYDIRNLMEGGFIFENPNAVRSCGCGTSFTAK
ncbi:MAG: iron-sulfur cluster assembly accessory protein [Armatimonadaceae bacterium]